MYTFKRIIILFFVSVSVLYWQKLGDIFVCLFLNKRKAVTILAIVEHATHQAKQTNHETSLGTWTMDMFRQEFCIFVSNLTLIDY